MSDEREFVGQERRQAYRKGAYLRLLAYLILVGAVIYSTARTYSIADQNRDTLRQVVSTQRQVEREGVERRDQACRSDESQHLAAVDRLKGTYAYLVTLPTNTSYAQLDQISKAVVRNVPQTEEEARTDQAPEFCDETLPGGVAVGLPEPDPIIPKRPAVVNELVQQAGVEQDKAKANRIVQDLRNADQRG